MSPACMPTGAIAQPQNLRQPFPHRERAGDPGFPDRYQQRQRAGGRQQPALLHFHRPEYFRQRLLAGHAHPSPARSRRNDPGRPLRRYLQHGPGARHLLSGLLYRCRQTGRRNQRKRQLGFPERLKCCCRRHGSLYQDRHRRLGGL